MPVPGTTTYANRSGVTFDITVQEAKVPPEADYFGYYFRVTERGTGLAHTHPVFVKKDLCPTAEQADRFVFADPMDYLQRALLEQYADGRSPLLAPDFSPGWMVC